MRRLVEEAGLEIELIKQTIAASKALDRPKISGPPPLPKGSKERTKPAPQRETLAGRLALTDAS